MYIFKNALRSISRAKARNVLIGLIVLVIAISACVALSIKESAAKAKEDTLAAMKITAQISADRQSMMTSFQSGQDGSFDRDGMKQMLQQSTGLTLEEYQVYAGAPSVESVYYSLTATLNASGELEPIDTNGTFSRDTTESAAAEAPSDQGGFSGAGKKDFAGKMGTQGDFTVVGYSSDEAMTDFTSGASSIADGTVFEEGTSEKHCIISEELATYNNLAVGSEITLANPNNETETVTLTVVGIYTGNASETASEMSGFSTATDSANRIYMSYPALKAIADASAENATETEDEQTGLTSSTAIATQLSYTYVFESLENYEAFEEEARALGLSDTYTVSSSDLTAFEQSLTPLNNLSKTALYFLIIVFAIGAIILIVINIFSIRERKYEIGVLTSIGMKKWKVALQFVTELFAVTLAAILIGAGIGAVTSVPVTNALLSAQIASNQQTSAAIQNNFGRESGAGRGGMTQMPGAGAAFGDAGEKQTAQPQGLMNMTASYISQVSYSTDLTVVLQMILIGIGLTLISGFAAILFIMRYEPLKILTNRD